MKNEVIHNKLVRDNILELIDSEEKSYTYHIADDVEYRIMLISKVIEELKEFEETPVEEEMADILEVIDNLIVAYSLDLNKIDAVKKSKTLKRG